MGLYLYYMNVTTINKKDNTNGYISKDGEHHYAQYQYEVQLPRGVVLKGTSCQHLSKEDGTNGCRSKGVASSWIHDEALCERHAETAT